MRNVAAARGRRNRSSRSGISRNYVYFAGGTIRFGKLTMADADLQLIDTDPRDPFDFFPAEYQRQLVAGYSRNTRRAVRDLHAGLRRFMRRSRVAQQRRQGPAPDDGTP